MHLRTLVGFGVNGAILLTNRLRSTARLGLLRMRFPGFSASGGVHISAGCRIYVHRGGRISLSNTYVARGVTLVAGRGSVLSVEADYIGHNSTVVARESIHIGAGGKIAENVVVRDADHDHSVPLSIGSFSSKPISIGEDVWLGAGSIVLKGVKIGRGSTVAAGAVVTKDVSESSTVVGVPARPTRLVSDR